MYSSNVLCAVAASGSFGHFQASKSGVHKGGLYQPLVKAGFVATRISVRLCLVDRFTSMDFAFVSFGLFLHFHVHVYFNYFRLQSSILKLLER